MAKRKRLGYDNPKMSGHIDITAEIDLNTIVVNIAGDPEGLRYMARFLEWMADYNLNEAICPFGQREHLHLHPGVHLGRSSCEVVLWRADAKGTGELPGYMKD